jgi:Fic family protein
MGNNLSMSPNEYQPTAPGRLVPIEIEERYVGRGGDASQGERRERVTRGHAFVPDPLPDGIDAPTLLGAIGVELEAASRGLGQLNGIVALERVPTSVVRLLSGPLVRREAVVSSRIEGTTASGRDVALLEAGVAGADETSGEVWNYVRALEHALAAERAPDVELACAMHEVLFEGVEGHEGQAGRVREVQNWIGTPGSRFLGARYVPPPAREVRGCLEALERAWREGLEGLPRVVTIALTHYQFEAVHPFLDGNGRIGRLLILVELVRSGLLSAPVIHLSGSFEANRREYYDAMKRVSTHGDWVGWVRLFLDAVARQAGESARIIVDVLEERERVMTEIAEWPEGVARLVDLLIESPAMTVSRAEKLLDVSNPTARNYLERLEGIGFVRELTGGEYAKVWGAVRILDLIEGGAG